MILGRQSMSVLTEATTSTTAYRTPPACVGADLLWVFSEVIAETFLCICKCNRLFIEVGLSPGWEGETLISFLSAVICEVWGKVHPPTLPCFFFPRDLC